MDQQTVQHHDGKEQRERPQRERMPPRYLQDYQTELYGRPPQQPQVRGAPEETSETVMLRQEVSQLKSMVRDLMDRVQQYEQSYSEGDTEEDCNPEPEEGQPAPYASNLLLPTDKGPPYEKAHSEPNLSESVAAPASNAGKVSQSAQTLFPCVHKTSALLECEHKNISASHSRSEPQLPNPPSPLPSASAAYIPPPVQITQAPGPVHHVSTHQVYPTATSQSSGTAHMGYGPHSQMPFQAMQPPPVPATQALPISSQLIGYHPSNTVPYQLHYMHPHPIQQPLAQSSVSQPPQVTYTSHFTGAIPPANPSFSLPVVPVQQTLSSRFSRVEGPSFPYFSHDDPHEFIQLKMALTNLLPTDEPELYKFHILLDHLQLPTARHIALSYAHDPQPFTKTLAALERQYGQPHQLALREIQTILSLPRVARGDAAGFQNFAIRLRSLVGMLQSLRSREGDAELACASHVQRLLSKLPVEQASNYARHTRSASANTSYNLVDFSAWLEGEAECQAIVAQANNLQISIPHKRNDFIQRPRPPTATILHGAERRSTPGHPASSHQVLSQRKFPCAYCKSTAHYLTNCEFLKALSPDNVIKWLKEQNRCWRCGRTHKAADCTLRKPCPKCNGRHLGVLHEVNTTQMASRVMYINPQCTSPKVLLKVVKVRLFNKDKTFDTYAILDDGSERTMLLPGAADHLGLEGEPERLELRTVRQQTEKLEGRTVQFRLSAASSPDKRYLIDRAFTSNSITFVEQSYPIEKLTQRYSHLHGLPLRAFSKVQPHILIGSDNPFLITPVERVQCGPKGSPAAVRTRLGWALQGPTYLGESSASTQCLFTSPTNHYAELKHHVEKLWEVDILPFRNERLISRSKQDTEAMDLLNAKTVRVNIEGIDRYATPLLRKKTVPALHAPANSVMPLLRRSERRLEKNREMADTYNKEINKLKESGYVAEIDAEQITPEQESWYIPHHLVEHNNKHRVVFNCSFNYQGQTLNDQLLPGPTLGPSLLGVLLRFRQHRVAMSGDIQGMFHQVRLLPEDRNILRFLWRDMKRNETPTVYEWQVLPFGTTCSPCCATFAVQKHIQDHSDGNEDVLETVLKSFYVDNCLKSLHCPEQAKKLLIKIRALLASGGFQIRQWASNFASVVDHLPSAARSDTAELWLNHNQADPVEGALGLLWHCNKDTLGYRYRTVSYQTLTLRNVYKVLASQYDPLGYLIPFTTRAKVLLQQLWAGNKSWDQPILPGYLQQAWDEWENELPNLVHISFPRWYDGNNPHVSSSSVVDRELHIFCDASERAYGSVAYMKTTNQTGETNISFVMARSRVAPLKQLTIPRLELSAALTGAQLSNLIKTELTVSITRTWLWSDSTVVLTWLHSESCRYKPFVANRIAEILDLTAAGEWRYVDTRQNPADDITRGKPLKALISTHRWHTGPAFLHRPSSEWPICPAQAEDITSELRKPMFCGITHTTKLFDLPDPKHYGTWKDLVEAVHQMMQTATSGSESETPASLRRKAEIALISNAQSESFSEEFQALKCGKQIPSHSRLLPLSPEFDEALEVIRVGGRLRQCDKLEFDTIHPTVLDPKHPLTLLLIKDYDERLLHPGPDRVFAEIRRAHWILRGRQAIKKHQWACNECRKWRGQPICPKMADLPPSRLRLCKPPFWSTGVDCFGPLHVTVGRRAEKRWGILFKCMTTRCVHIEILTSLHSDSFLMSLRRFIARRGRPYELLSDCGTNFKGGDRELRDAFTAMDSHLREQLSHQQIHFKFNPPNAPHFGGMWEREIRSIKAALRVTLGSQSVPEEVLHTVLLEIEGILNAKPIGYASSDVADPDPITPNILLMGRRDASLPQAMYADTNLLGRRRWRHSQILADQFWSRFIKNYLPNLQVRNKWQKDAEDLTVGAVVLMMDPQQPRGMWPVGKVARTFPGPDGRTRTVEVTCEGKTYIRPVARLVNLPSVNPDRD